MARRHNHYEAAFEAYLRERRVPYIAVDETRRALCGEDESLKNLDFLVSQGAGGNWLVDVKGRRFPSGNSGPYWKNWSTKDELESLCRWETTFGPSFNGLLVFAYWLVADRSPVPLEEIFRWKGRLYAFIGIRLDHYLSDARQISPRWNTVTLPTARFRHLARPVAQLFAAGSILDRPRMAPSALAWDAFTARVGT